jgi:DNA-binding response OmpR family regulator
MRLLMIEDENELARLVKKSLVKAGFSVDVAHDGIEGEYLGNESIYELAIVDLGLPKRPGLEVLKNWRAKQNALPVIILTARDTWQEKVDGFKAGTEDYLSKPFHIEELLARINALLNRVHNHSGGILTAGDFQLDTNRQAIITQSGDILPLTGSEFKLLRCFILHKDQVLSKTILMDHIYDSDSDKDSNVIEVYVNHLRNKLGKDRIETRRGQGYIFKDTPQ